MNEKKVGTVDCGGQDVPSCDGDCDCVVNTGIITPEMQLRQCLLSDADRFRECNMADVKLEYNKTKGYYYIPKPDKTEIVLEKDSTTGEYYKVVPTGCNREKLGFYNDAAKAFYYLNLDGVPIYTYICTNRGLLSSAAYTALLEKIRAGRKGKGKGKRMLGINSKVRSLAIKCYDEQFTIDWDKLQAIIAAIDKTKYHVIGIKHDRDVEVIDFWISTPEKPHYHIIIRILNNKSERVQQLLDMLGVVFRPGLDDILLEHNGIDTVGRYDEYATYLTHDTAKAIADHKEPYALEELVSNLTQDEILQVRDGYTRVSENARKVTQEDLIELDKAAYDLGYELKDFDKWYGAQPFAVRSNVRMRTIKESYMRGVDAKIAERNGLVRLCVFIKGDPDTGKTYGAEHAVPGKTYIVKGGGSGKFDNLSADYNGIVIDDDVCPNLLNMTDNYICRAYKRNKNNPPWAGKYFIVTSNLTFEDWLESCGICMRDRYNKINKHYDAMKSRFYICDVKYDALNYTHKLVCKSISDRGTFEEQSERMEMFKEFKNEFNKIMSTYRTKRNSGFVDYSEVLN